LEHVIARAFLLSDSDELDQLHLPEEPDAPSPEGAQPVMTLREAEERAIRAALATTGGAREKTAKLLGISRTALYEKLKRMKG
ncbi:MAG: helix-turn-helix domain-containing protein, partial [Planctomycetota bacterium]